ncbi:MAG: hypothetical protein ACRER8_22140 [Pseudomonas sp.]|uniref:hypothetical protein n=1 Tax=Pseudomonas sp. TaxID=306 RepID=UPI003D6F2DE2
MDNFDDFDNFDDLPDLGHWKSAMEFSVEQAALLLAMIDPFDYESLLKAKASRVPRWKNAAGHAIGIVSAIRQGLISPVVCKGFKLEEMSDWNGNKFMERVLQTVRASDRDAEISMPDTIITRASLIAWIESEKVQFTKPPKPITKTVAVQTIAKVIESAAPQPAPLALPLYSHSSEGLDLVQETIKHFWATYDEDDISTAPSKEDILKFLTSKGASGRMSEAVDLILRPFNLRTAHLRNRKAPTRENE